MKHTKLSFFALAAATAVVLAGCAGSDDSAGSDDAPEAAPTFAAGSTMERLASEGSITIGTKFDQPLFGLVGPDGTPEGFDVEIGKLIAEKLGIDDDNINWVET